MEVLGGRRRQGMFDYPVSREAELNMFRGLRCIDGHVS